MATPLIIKVLRLPPALNAQVDAYATSHGLSWTAATLILLRAALEIATRPPHADSPVRVPEPAA